jgi:hypothetical protein
VSRAQKVLSADYTDYAEEVKEREEHSMKLCRIICLLTATSLLSSSLIAGAIFTSARHADEHFSVKEYNEFHRVLHVLQHEALPQKDFQRIRANAGQLVKHGEAIVKLGVPTGTAAKNVEEFRKELKKFDDALVKFREHAKAGTDQQLEGSFSSVHDSFEVLAGMLPRK